MTLADHNREQAQQRTEARARRIDRALADPELDPEHVRQLRYIRGELARGDREPADVRLLGDRAEEIINQHERRSRRNHPPPPPLDLELEDEDEGSR